MPGGAAEWGSVPLDSRGHGSKDPLEACKIARRINTIKRMFSFFDVSGDGLIDIDEFGEVS